VGRGAILGGSKSSLMLPFLLGWFYADILEIAFYSHKDLVNYFLD